MKKFVKVFASVAAAAAVLASCAKESRIQAPEKLDGNIHVKALVAAFESDEVQSRTYIGDYDGKANRIIWGTGEYMKLAVTSADSTAFATSLASSADANNGGPQARFDFSVKPKAAASYLYQGIYPASAAVASSNTNPAAYKVELPSSQNATAGSYDPAAYILLAQANVFDFVSSEWTAQFRRATALNVVTLTGIDEDIVSVEFVAPDDVSLSGRRYFNLATGEIGEIYSGNSSVKVKYATPITGVQKYVWFTTWGATIASGKELTIVAKSATHTYTRTITARAEGISFKQGWLNKLGVDMTSAQVEEIVNLSGNYLIAAYNTKWALMNGDNPGKFFPEVSTTVTTAPANVDFEAFQGLSTINNYIWTVTAVDGGYTIKNAYKNIYLALSADANEAYAVDAVDEEGNTTLFTLTIDPATHAAVVNSVAYGERNLNYNSGSSRFAFYKPASKMAQVYLIPAVVDPRARVELSFDSPEVSIPTSESGAYVGQFVTVMPAEGEVTSAIEYSWDNDNLGMIDEATGELMLGGQTGTAVVTATFPGSTNFRPATASYQLTVYDASVPAYVKVTSALTDWTGEYLLVSEGGSKAADSVMVLSGITGTTTKIGTGTKVFLGSAGRIATSTELAPCKVNIWKSAVAGKVVMEFGGKYLCWGSGNSLDYIEDEIDNSRWDISAGATTGNWLFTNAAQNTRVIWYNTGSPRFACYEGKSEASAGYAPLQLYKLEDKRGAAGIEWESSVYSAILQTGNITDFETAAPRLTNPHSVSVRFVSSDESVATFSKSDGSLVAHKAGQCIISAVFDGNSSYAPTRTSYILTVTDNRDAVATPTFSPAEGAVAAGTVVTFSCTTEGATFYYTTNGANPTTSSTRGNTFTVNETVVLKVLAVCDGYKNSEVATATYTVGGVQANDGSLERPYNATEAANLALSGDTGTYFIAGKISRVAYQFSTGGTASFWISEDGTAETFEGYKIKYVGNMNWITGYVLLNVGDEVVFNGTLTTYTPSGGGDTVPETTGGFLVSINGIKKALSVPEITATPDNANKKITVAWAAATGTEATVSYVVKCGDQTYNATAAGSHDFVMSAYGTYDISVAASAADALPATGTAKAKLEDPSIQSYSVTYTVTSKTAVSTTGTAPTGSAATYSQTYSTVSQATSGNSFTLTLSGFAGKKITGATVKVKSNKSGGAGYLSLVSGSSTIAAIGTSSSGVVFSNAAWNGAYSTSYVDKDLTVTATTIADGASIVLTIGATTNSLYFQALTLTYE